MSWSALVHVVQCSPLPTLITQLARKDDHSLRSCHMLMPSTQRTSDSHKCQHGDAHVQAGRLCPHVGRSEAGAPQHSTAQSGTLHTTDDHTSPVHGNTPHTIETHTHLHVQSAAPWLASSTPHVHATATCAFQWSREHIINLQDSILHTQTPTRTHIHKHTHYRCC